MSEVMAAQMNTHGDEDDTTCPHAIVIVLHCPHNRINPADDSQALNLGTSDFSCPKT